LVFRYIWLELAKTEITTAAATETTAATSN